MSNPRVLVATTTYSGKHYAFKKWWKGVQDFTYPVSEFLIVDNTDDEGQYARKLRRITNNKLKVIHAPRLEDSRDTLSYSQNVIRDYAVRNDYDFWMSVESDVVPPPTTIESLLRWNKPVVGGIYEIGFENKIGRYWCIFITDQKGNGMNGTRILQKEESAQMVDNPGLYKVHGMGIGCTLIRRDIFERFPFWTDKRFTNKHSDVYFYMDLWNNQVPVYIDTTITCEHYNSDWSLVSDR
jgi:hypothetical protein